MNYSNHSLRADLQEWNKRLLRASYEQFGHQLKFLLNKLETNIQLKGIINELIRKNEFENKTFQSYVNDPRIAYDMGFDDEAQQASFCYQYILYLVNETNHNLHHFTFFSGKDFQSTKEKIINNYISPIINFLHDKLDKSNATIFLLEKYKKRTEWYTKESLRKKYLSVKKNFEDVLDANLRLFLFDQGVDYPISSPKTDVGRPDLVGQLDTDDPIVLEVKVLDMEKKYGKTRIKSGFSQLVKYTDSWGTDVGYFIIFNLDDTDVNFLFEDNNNVFPPSLTFNNKVYYFVVVNLADTKPASKKHSVDPIEITEDYITK